MARAREFHALGDQRAEINGRAEAPMGSKARLAGLQNLLDRALESVGVAKHELVKMLALGFLDVAALKRFEVQANRGDRSLQFVSDGVDEAIVLLVAADFANQKERVQDHAGNDRGEENDAEEQEHRFAPIQDDPTDVQRDRQRNQAHAQRDEECNGLPATGDFHGSNGLYRYARCMERGVTRG